MHYEYQVLRQKLRAQTRKCRDRDLRIKVELILLVHQLGSVSEACARRGFSRKFYYKWWNRLKKKKYSIAALQEKSRRPKSSPLRISKNIENKIKLLRRKRYGSRMIKAFLSREGIELSHSTISHVLRERIRKPQRRRRSLKAHPRRYELHIPGQRFQMDVKYAPHRVQNQQVYVYVAIDECTRWRYAFAYRNLNENSTVDFLKRLKRLCPFPIQKIQTDNGWEFTYRFFGPKKQQHPMDKWCEENNVEHSLIPPGEKELNGKVERSHRIDEDYFYWRASTSDFVLFRRQLGHWMQFYNHLRPHGGAQYKTPIEKLKEATRLLKTFPHPPTKALLRFSRQLPNQKPEEQKLKNDPLLQDVEIQLKKLYDAA